MIYTITSHETGPIATVRGRNSMTERAAFKLVSAAQVKLDKIGYDVTGYGFGSRDSYVYGISEAGNPIEFCITLYPETFA